MILDWSIMFLSFGSIGWLLILREAFRRMSQGRLNHCLDAKEFQVHYLSSPIGRVRFVALEWREHLYCIAVDMQGACVQLIDKCPKKS